MKRFLVFLVAFLLAGPALGQDFDFSVDLGGGSLASEKPAWDNLFGSVQVGGIDLPFDIASGVSVEMFNDDEWLSVPGMNFWSLNRRPVVSKAYAGSDLKIGEYVLGENKFDFDLRLVAGWEFNDKLKVEVYTLEDDKPVAFALFWNVW